MTWAFAPPNPNELTPAIRSAVPFGKGSSWVGTRNFSFSKSMCGFGFEKWRLGGIWACLRTSIALISPAMPAAVSKWPRLVFIEPIGSGASTDRLRQRASARACASIGSPTAVPVPWASTNPIFSGAIPASRQASCTSRVCASGLGSQMPLVCPS